MKRKTFLPPLLLALALGLLPDTGLRAEGWSGSIGIAAAGLSISGSEGSFRSQFNLDEGIFLEDLDLGFRGEEGKRTELALRASGFGGAEPAQRFDLDLRLHAPWRFELDYDRRESFFAVEGYERGLRTDDWEIERWRAGVVWDGWKAARLRFDLRHHDRQGTVERPLFGLNELYPLRVDLDESMQETAFTLETRNLPVTLLFEQSFATYERRNGREPAGSESLGGGDPDDPETFVVADERRTEERDIPTTRLVATYGSPRVEVVGAVLWSEGELDMSGPVTSGFGILGGLAGQVEFIDDFVGSADMDRFTGNLRIGIRLADAWTLRLESDYRDTATDATLTGERILRLTSPFGNVIDIPGAVDNSSVVDVTDDDLRLTVEWSGGGWAVWAGGFDASRDVRWHVGQADPDQTVTDVTRDSDGYLAGASWSGKTEGGKAVSGSVEVQHGSFDGLVFRTDPETTDRLTLRLRAELGKGWHARLQGRLIEAEDRPTPEVAIPESQAVLDRSSDAWGAGLDWSSEDGKSGFGVDLDLLDLATATDLLVPDGSLELSVYDLSLLTAAVHGRHEVGKVRLSGSATRLDDSGDTWPLESWIARGRVGVEVRSGVEVAAFGEYWSYDEERAEADDFDVTRYGLGLRWSF